MYEIVNNVAKVIAFIILAGLFVFLVYGSGALTAVLIFIPFLISIYAYAIYSVWREASQKPSISQTICLWIKRQFAKVPTKENRYRADNSRELVMLLLKDLNCQLEERDGDIIFSYQNWKFWIEPYHPSFITIISHMGGLDLDSSTAEEIDKLKELVNTCNNRCSLPIFYYEMDPQKKSIDVYAIRNTVFRQEIPNLRELFVVYLESFFDARTNFIDQFHLKLQEKEEKGRVVVKGFGGTFEEKNNDEENKD